MEGGDVDCGGYGKKVQAIRQEKEADEVTRVGLSRPAFVPSVRFAPQAV